MSTLGRVLTCGGLVAGGVVAAVALPGAAAPALAGAAAASLAGLASNVLASDLHRALVDQELDPLANHDLRRVVSNAVSATLRDVASRCGRLSLDHRRLRRIARITARGWGALTNQHLFEGIDERHVVEWFTAAGADSARAVRVLEPRDWQTLVEDLCRETLGWFGQPSAEAKAALAQALEEGFFARVRGLVKNDLETGGRAYAALQLDFMHVAMRALGRIGDQLEAQRQLSSESLVEMRRTREALAAQAERCWNGLDAAAQRQLSGLHDRLDAVARELTLRLERLADDVRATRAAAEQGLDASLRIEQLLVARLHVARGATTNFPEAGVRRNPGFVGRERELAQLHARLAHASTAITEAVVADGGLGKSQLAVEYAFRHADEWEGRWFVDCRSEATIEPHLRQILSAFGIEAPANAPFEAMLATLRAKLSQGRHLLLLDDLRDPADLARLCPAGGGSRALATTRRTDLPPHLASTLSLDVLDPPDARALLRQGRDDLRDARHDAALDAAAEHLGRHALALAFANAVLRTAVPRIGPEELKQRLSRALVGDEAHLFAGSDVDPASAAAGYRLRVAESLTLLVPWLGQPGNEAEKRMEAVLAAASLLAPRAIPLALLLAGAGREPNADEAAWIGALQTLESISVLRFDDRERSSVAVHGLTQQVVRARLAGRAVLAHAEDRLLVPLTELFRPAMQDEPSAWPKMTSHVSQLQALLIASASPDPRRGMLWNQLGYFLKRVLARYDAALEAYREAERIDRAAFGNDHPIVATLVNNIGGVLRAQGDLGGALSSYREAERIDRAAFGNDHPEVATDVNNIGSVVQAQGDLDGALSSYREAERIDRAAFGNDHPNVATRVNNIGGVLRAQGDLDGALSSYREAERIDRAAFGSDHPEVATEVNNIGFVLQAQGDLDGALSSYREAERIDRAAFGSDHPIVATLVNNIGGVLHAQGDLDGALFSYREAERIDRAAFGNDHPEVATDVNNIGSVLHAKGDLAAARASYRDALRIAITKLGPRANHTAVAARNLRSLGADPLAIAAEFADAGAVAELREQLGDRS